VPPATQKPCTLQTTGVDAWNSVMNARTLRLIIAWSTSGSHVPDGSWLRAIVIGSSGEPGGGVSPPADASAAASPSGPKPPSPIPSALATRS